MFHSVENSGVSVTQILREINFGDSRRCKTAVFAILGTLNFVGLANLALQKAQKLHIIQISELLNLLK